MAYRDIHDQIFHYFGRPHVGAPTGPVGGEAAWTADQLDESDWMVHLTGPQIEELAVAVASAQRDVTSMGELTRQSFPLPELEREFADWRRRIIDGLGFVLVRGLPVDRWPREDVEWAFWGLGQHLGEPGTQNTAQELLGHVTDYHDATGSDQREYRTSGEIDFHCDAADVVGLCCISTSREGGASRLVSSVTVFDRLAADGDDAADVLFDEFALDSRQDDPVSPPWIPVQPCCFDGEKLRTFMHLGYFGSAGRHEGVEVPSSHRRALHSWSEVANRDGVALSMQLQPGDIQWVSNHTVAHARSAYVDDPGSPRELLRLWLSIDSDQEARN